MIMKKKVWVVSVLEDKPFMQEFTSDFYTSDTDANLIIRLADGDFNPERATVTLVNANNESIVSEEHPVKDDTITFPMYTAERSLIEHQGTWRFQIIYVKNNEKYTSKVISFPVASYLLDGGLEPSLERVESWELIAEQAEAMMSDYEEKSVEIGTLVGSVTEGEQARESNEQARLENMAIVQGWINNPGQFDGRNIEYNWRGTELGVRLEGDVDYVYVDLKGETGQVENLTATHVKSALGFIPKNYTAGNNIAITDDTISVTGQPGLTEEEVKLVKVNRATDTDTVAGHTVAKDVPADANFNDTIVDITGKADQVDLDDLQNQLTELLGVSVVSEVGHAGIRIWQKKFEYWDGTKWIEIETGGGGPAIKVGNVSDLTANAKLGNKVDIAWNDPDDVVFEGATLAQWAGTQLRRKEGTYPIDETQGTLVVDSTVRNQFSAGYEDVNLTEGMEYFYALFPYTESGQFTIDPANRVSATAFNKYERTAPSAPTVKDIVLLEATVTGDSESVVSLDQSNWFSSPHTFTGLTESTTYTPHSKIEETAEYYESAVVAGSSFTAIAKDTQPAPSKPTISGLEFDRVTVAGVAGTEVRLDSGAWHDSPHTFTGLTEETSYTAYARMKGTATKLASPSSAGRVFVTEVEQKIYGVIIDESNSNPETSVTYTDDAVGFTPMAGNNGNHQWGSWESTFNELNIKPCLVKSGTVNYYLNPNDYTKKADGSAADITSGNDGDVMVEFPKLYWKMEKLGTKQHVKWSVKPFPGAECPAHTVGSVEKDKIYVSAYMGHNLSGKLRSLSGKTPTASQTIGTFRSQAQANGSGYQQMGYYPLLMLQVLYITFYKSRDAQTALGRGYVDGNSSSATIGATNKKGMFYGETTGKQQNKFCGVEDFWGNVFYWIDGFYSDSNRNLMISKQDVFNDTGSGYVNHGQGATSNFGGYIDTVQGGTNTGFIIKTGGGSNSTHYSDYGHLNGGYLPRFGGYWASGSNAGAFRLTVNNSASNSSSNLGARVCFIGN